MSYIERLTRAVEKMHACKAQHTGSVPFTETFRDQIVWSGVVETFALTGHPKATICYAWGAKDGIKEDFTAVLHLSPVDSPQKAVKAYICANDRSKNEPL